MGKAKTSFSQKQNAKLQCKTCMLLFSLARRRPSTLLIVMVCPITSIVPDIRLQDRRNQNQQAGSEKGEKKKKKREESLMDFSHSKWQKFSSVENTKDCF